MITIERLSKAYRSLVRRREVHALTDFSLDVPRGEVLGIAGPNGAGKSTLISLLLGFLQPTDGALRIDGLPPRRYMQRQGAGYLPELVALPPRWTVNGALRRAADLGRTPFGRIAVVTDLAGLGDQGGTQVRHLSKGNYQRLGLALAVLDDRDLLVLDEPTHGLDPVWTVRFRSLIGELRRPDRTILIASHNLDELERVADRVAILHHGRLESVVAPHGGPPAAVYRLVMAPGGGLETLEMVWPGAEPVPGRGGTYRVTGELGALNQRLRSLIEAGGQVISFQPEHSQLEQHFRDAVGDG